MKVALVIPNNIWVSPYVKIYTRLFDEAKVCYDVISWNREGRKEEGIQFDYNPRSRTPLSLLFAYKKYSLFVKHTLKHNRYDKLIVFTPQSAVFLADFLAKKYRGNYIFDYRDLSIEQKPMFRGAFCKVLRNSYANVISSPGFTKYLPKGFEYVISHNFNVDNVKQALESCVSPINKGNVSLLTIGALRKDMNVEVIDELGNAEGVTLSFVGKGPSSQFLENYVAGKQYQNISFKGFYQKEEEKDYISECNFINIYYPQIPSHIAAISNRFYNSLIYKRPMLVTHNSTQGDYAEKYGVGLAIEDCENLQQRMDDYLAQLDYPSYCERCNTLLKMFLSDYEKWEETVLTFAH